MNRLTIVSTENTNNRITVTFEVTDGLKNIFNPTYISMNTTWMFPIVQHPWLSFHSFAMFSL